ncbi:MAG: hypothetical protein RMX96_23535 [Nostoc sp. ChiSLP02]|nr:hypothetical protein [Nostoc sp. DedSLP05]MDZ8102393.1 hypothetical protein [Nostoc sp. DedSLP01]MDZ8187809.1 hypothetical protein [Nostoc sp. ChiSLP02]
MQHFRQLLEIQNSQLGQLLRFTLSGLEATLNHARAEFPLDPGVKLCDELLQELHNLLQPAPTPLHRDIGWEDTIISPQNTLKLNHLREAFDSDSELNFYLGNSQLQSKTDSDLWNEIQRKLLRIPEELGALWRQRSLDMAQEVGAIADSSNLYQLPFIRDEIIYPGLSGSVQTQGLSLSQQALLNSQTSQVNESDLAVGFLFLYIKFLEIEPDLYHALKSLCSFDIISLHSKSEQRHQYINALSDRCQRTQKAEDNADPVSILRAWIDMDEAIHSLVFLPPADRYSWWGKLQSESRRILKKAADRAINEGYEVRIRQLSGLYADICASSKDDLQLDFGGTPGEVLTCLRVYTRINHEESPGRVIFRSSR